jgi:uncharacterized protein involved in type VI secretion and phage assembly
MSVDRTDFERPTSEPSKGWYGVYSAMVTDNKDPQAQGRLKIVFDGQEYWARLATLIAGYNRGTWFIPDVNDEVLIAFEGGDVRRPYVIGALWNSRDGPPESMDAAGRNGNSIKLESSGMMVTAPGKLTINASIMEVAAGMITVSSGMSKFSGVVQCDTLISNSVISSSYSPGAGNIW